MCGKKTLAVLMFGICLSGVAHADMTNPGFEAGLSGWTVASGAVLPYADGLGTFALLQDTGGYNGPARSSIYQDFVVLSGDVSLSFEYLLLTSGQYVGAGVLPDAFSARLIDPISLAPLLSSPGVNDYFYHDTRGAADSIGFDPGLVTVSLTAARPDWSTVRLNLAGLTTGTTARLQFDLLGTGLLDGQMTFAGIDNLVIRNDGGGPVVPAPSAVILGLIGLAMIRLTRAKCS
jgi:hypothetical protein